jgi:hypothetical protein
MKPDPEVRRWLDEQVADTRDLCSVTVAKSMRGIAALPEGKGASLPRGLRKA